MRIVAYRGASALGVLALCFWAIGVRDPWPFFVVLLVFLAGVAAACFHQCDRHDTPSPEKFRRLTRYGGWTVLLLTGAASVVLLRSADRPLQLSLVLVDIAVITSLVIAWPTYLLWYTFAFKKHVEAKRKNAKLQEDVDFAEDERGNAVRSPDDPE